MRSADHSHSLAALVRRGRGPLGPPAQVDFGVRSGPLAELATCLAHTNGFTSFNAGIQFFRAGPTGLGPELASWNARKTWKSAYGGRADRMLCFAQDLFGVQFAIEAKHNVIAFDPETADKSMIGTSLQDWADWLFSDPDVHGTHAFATAWQDRHGPLGHTERLLPRQFFTLGGAYTADNLLVKEAAHCMRVRGPVARRVYGAADGTIVHLAGRQHRIAGNQ